MTAITTIGQIFTGGVAKKFKGRAVKQATKRVFVEFAGKNPDWVDVWFDEHFLLTHSSGPARQIVAGEMPRGADLAEAWAAQLNWHSIETRQKYVAELTPLAADFMRQLQTELAEA